MSILAGLGSGLAGACAVTTVHESVRRIVPEAPRMDVLGMRAISKSMEKVGMEAPPEGTLHQAALAGDLITNTLYYSLVGLGGPRGALVRGAALGLAAGLGAVLLPGPMGLGEQPSRRTRETALMTVGWYLLGGLAAAAAYKVLANEDPS